MLGNEYGKTLPFFYLFALTAVKTQELDASWLYLWGLYAVIIYHRFVRIQRLGRDARMGFTAVGVYPCGVFRDG